MNLLRILTTAALCGSVAASTSNCRLEESEWTDDTVQTQAEGSAVGEEVEGSADGGSAVGEEADESGDTVVDGENVLLFVGTYTQDLEWVVGTGTGVHVFNFNTNDGSLTEVGAQAFGDNPSFIAGSNDADRRVIYAVSQVSVESAVNASATTGYVYAISVEADGTMTELNRVESGGGDPCHVSVSPNEDYVAVSNFAGGSVSIFPINEDGSLEEASDFHQFTGGSNVNEWNQEAAHMHSMTWVGGDSTGVIGADLGNDRLALFNLNEATGKLEVDENSMFVDRPAGSGPRHMAIHPNQEYAYVVDEFLNTVGVYELDAASGSLPGDATQVISTLPEDDTEGGTSADIHISEDGAFLYTSNRGHDSIAMFQIEADGQLTSLGHESSQGEIPRNFHIYEDFMLVANRDTNNIEVFKIDSATGSLSHTGQSAECPTPASLFIPRY